MPLRTCVICRRKGEKRTFLRFVLHEALGVFLDIAQGFAGRGTYCCATAKCLGAKNLGSRVVFALEKGSASSRKAVLAKKKAAQEKATQKDSGGGSSRERSEVRERLLGEKAVGLRLLDQALQLLEQSVQSPQGQARVRDLNKLRESLLKPSADKKTPKKRTSSIRL